MKLKCDQHKNRVVVVNGKFIHRNGAGDVCSSPTASIGGEQYTARGVQQFGLIRPPRSVKTGSTDAPE